MKKAAILIALISLILTFAACGEKEESSPEQYSKYVAAEESKQAEESKKEVERISEKMDEVSDDIGKTVKNKKVVLRQETSSDTRYRVLYMDKDGNGDYMVTYYFAKSNVDYQTLYDNAKAEGNLYKFDKKSKMVAVKSDNLMNLPFDNFYENYAGDLGWTLVE